MSSNIAFSHIDSIAYTLKVCDVMKKNFIIVQSDANISKLQNSIKKNKNSEILVVDKKKLIGIIDHEDIKTMQNNPLDRFPIFENMSPIKEWFYHDDILATMVNQFEQCGSRFPVLNRKTEKVVGTIARCDIVMALLKEVGNVKEKKGPPPQNAPTFFNGIQADDVNLHLEYTIQSRNFDTAGEASNKLKKTLKRLALSKNIIQRVSIISYETEMNMVIYSHGGNIVFSINPQKIVMQANDKGPGIPDIEKAMQSGYSTAPDWVRELGFGAGMGLQNIEQYSDHMDLKSKPGKGTNLTVIVKS